MYQPNPQGRELPAGDVSAQSDEDSQKELDLMTIARSRDTDVFE